MTATPSVKPFDEQPDEALGNGGGKRSSTLYCYGVLSPRHGMCTVKELEYYGWVRVRPHPWYESTWLMKKECNDGNCQID